MGAHFAVPDAREFSTDIGFQDAGCALHGCTTARISEVLLLLGDIEGALAYTSEDVMSMALMASAHLSGKRARGRALAAKGEPAAATACLEAAAAGARELGLFMHELQAVLALVSCSPGGAGVDATARLRGLVQRLDGTPEQIAALLRDRDGNLPVDLDALLRDAL